MTEDKSEKMDQPVPRIFLLPKGKFMFVMRDIIINSYTIYIDCLV